MVTAGAVPLSGDAGIQDVRAEIEALRDPRDRILPRHQDDPDRVRRLQLAKDIKPGDHGHHDVEEQHVGIQIPDPVDRRLAVVGGGDVEPLVSEAASHQASGGELVIGELAVWVGVSAAHRDEAFAACRYVIYEVKQRLPAIQPRGLAAILTHMVGGTSVTF